MTLHEAIDAFIEQRRAAHQNSSSDAHAHAIRLLKKYCSVVGANSLDDLTPARLRDFMARWWVEESSAIHKDLQPSQESRAEITDPKALLDALADFVTWLGEQTTDDSLARNLSVIEELRRTVPRALEIRDALSRHIAERGGPFGFPQFLTSFEEGGHSEYDIGASGDTGAIEGHFLVTQAEGVLIEAEDLISEERVWPIILPLQIARLIAPGYILNLEIIRAEDGWQIAGSGLVYPPGTDIL